jgi:RHS repeat-associated protein
MSRNIRPPEATGVGRREHRTYQPHLLSIGCHFRKICRARLLAYHPLNELLPARVRTCFEGPFGEVIRATGPMAKGNPFRFSTKYQDDETDLLYYGYRYYNASTGRWLSRDPFEESGFKAHHRPRQASPAQVANSANPTVPANNNLVCRFDLLGLYSPRGPIPDGSCCLETSYPKSCAEICRIAHSNININPGIGQNGGGTVICYHGKACGCLGVYNPFGYSPHDCPVIDQIMQAHEDHHASLAKCTKCGLYFPGPADLPFDVDKEECEQRKKELAKLQAARDSLSPKCQDVADQFIRALADQTKGCL